MDPGRVSLVLPSSSQRLSPSMVKLPLRVLVMVTLPSWLFL